MSLAKAIGTALAAFVCYTIFGVFMGSLLAFAAALPMRLLGFDGDSTPLVAVAAVAFACVMFVCWANALDEAIDAIKTRPRGLGQRRVTKWKDGIPHEHWEKY